MKDKDVALHALLDESFKRGLLAAIEVVKAQPEDCPPHVVAAYLQVLANGPTPKPKKER